MTETAMEFFDACETGKGWEVCSQYCSPDATFSCQADALAEIHTVEGYTEWTKAILTPMPDGGYELKSFATDEERSTVCIFSVFSGTHTGEGGPVPPTGKTTHTEYVYALRFEGDKIVHMTKVWNSGFALAELGWG